MYSVYTHWCACMYACVQLHPIYKDPWKEDSTHCKALHMFQMLRFRKCMKSRVQNYSLEPGTRMSTYLTVDRTSCLLCTYYSDCRMLKLEWQHKNGSRMETRKATSLSPDSLYKNCDKLTLSFLLNPFLNCRMSLLQMSSPVWGNLVLTTATRAA